MTYHAPQRNAFSLLELFAALIIIGILAILIAPRLMSSSTYAKVKTCHHNRTDINLAVERFFIEKSLWPADNLSDIGADAEYFSEGMPACPVSGQAYRLDPTTRRVVGHAGRKDHSP